MAHNIAVIVEHWRGRISPITYELLALGREIADQSLAPLQALLLGHGARDLARSLGIADSVLYLDHPALSDPVPEVYSQVLASELSSHSFDCVLSPMTTISVGLGSLLAERLRIPSFSSCKDLRLVSDSFEATCLLYGGKLEMVVNVSSKPAVFSVRSGTRPAQRGHSERAPLIQDASVRLPRLPPVQLKNYLTPQPGDLDITEKQVLVAVGRGLQGPEHLPDVERLAESLGGAVCGSRPAIDFGWLPLSRQVGCSGLTVHPRLYLALGVSGAPEHIEGIRESELIVAVNSDPQAPIFQHAHYGIVADAIELVPLLTQAVQTAKQASLYAQPGRRKP